MVSEFRRKKILELFTYYDEGKTGFVEKKSFDFAVKDIAKAMKYNEGDAKYKQIEETMKKIWDGILKEDQDGDGKISPEEWISIWNKYAKNPNNPDQWQVLYSKLCFSLYDTSNDGNIDKDEFVSVNESFGVNKDAAATAFDKMARGKSSISWPEFQELYQEYFASDDPNAPGNALFVPSA